MGLGFELFVVVVVYSVVDVVVVVDVQVNFGTLGRSFVLVVDGRMGFLVGCLLLASCTLEC